MVPVPRTMSSAAPYEPILAKVMPFVVDVTAPSWLPGSNISLKLLDVKDSDVGVVTPVSVKSKYRPYAWPKPGWKHGTAAETEFSYGIDPVRHERAVGLHHRKEIVSVLCRVQARNIDLRGAASHDVDSVHLFAETT